MSRKEISELESQIKQMQETVDKLKKENADIDENKRILKLRETWTIPVLIKRWTKRDGDIDYIELLMDLQTIYPGLTDDELMKLVNNQIKT